MPKRENKDTRTPDKNRPKSKHEKKEEQKKHKQVKNDCAKMAKKGFSVSGKDAANV